ncbi:MAG TPA: DUF1778 domain-containing protein [Pirellulaceae bacterium]|nr:DUF1778 domain-containing protein [Pirellulaceae bacterium]
MAGASPKSQERLNFRLPADLKQAIEAGAAALGQSVSDFAISTLYQRAQEVLRDREVSVLSAKDRATFLKLLDGKVVRPNAALRKAAARYKKHLG